MQVINKEREEEKVSFSTVFEFKKKYTMIIYFFKNI